MNKIEQWQRVIGDYETSDHTQKEFCQTTPLKYILYSMIETEKPMMQSINLSKSGIQSIATSRNVGRYWRVITLAVDLLESKAGFIEHLPLFESDAISVKVPITSNGIAT